MSAVFFVIGFLVGGIVGVVAMCLVVGSHTADEEDETECPRAGR